MIVKLQFKRGKWAEMMTAYKQMLLYIKSAVTRNYSEKVINKILDLVSGSQQMELLQVPRLRLCIYIYLRAPCDTRDGLYLSDHLRTHTHIYIYLSLSLSSL